MHVSITLRDHPPPIDKVTSHDLRRTAATQMAEALGIPLETIARVLGHVAGGASTRILTSHYLNAEFIEQKTTALLAWDARLRSIITGEIAPAANVVALAEARKALAAADVA
jgi:integrase